MSRSRVLRIAKGSALLGFAAGALHAVFVFTGRTHVREFQAGDASTVGEKALAIVHTAAIEGLGFGALGLLAGSCAVLGARLAARGRAPSGSAVAAVLLFSVAGFLGWTLSAWAAEDALPHLTTPAILLLDLAGIAAAIIGFGCFHLAMRRLPGARGAPGLELSSVVGSITAAGTATALALSHLLAVSEGWRSPRRLAVALFLFVLALPLAVLLARILRRPTSWIAGRLANRPLVPRPLTLGAGALLALSVAGTAPFFRISALPSGASYPAADLPADPASDMHPNVVFVTVDTLRADHLGAYGYPRPTSPFLDSVAAAGARFSDVVAPAAWTKPSTGTLFTGLYPSRHGALYHGSSLKLPDGMRTLAEAFRERGYVTAGFVSNPNIKAVFDFDRGFDLFFDSPVEDTLTLACIRASLTGRILTSLIRHQFNWNYENDVRQINEHVIAWLEENHDAPFFLYVHYIDPHVPYDPPASYREQFEQEHGFAVFNKRAKLVGQDLYDAEIRYTDDGLRELVERLRGLGIWERTLFVFTSDHGEEFFEHEVLGHGFSLFQAVIRVPLVLHGPAVPAGGVIEEPVQILDLPSTVLDLAGFGVERFGDGRSFAGALRDRRWSGDTEYFLENEFGQDYGNQRAFAFTGVRKGRWKLVLTEHNAFFPPENPANARQALYDLWNDPAEEKNLIGAEEHRAIAEGMLEGLRRHSQFLVESGFRDATPSALTPDVEASLRALGYVE